MNRTVSYLLGLALLSFGAAAAQTTFPAPTPTTPPLTPPSVSPTTQPAPVPAPTVPVYPLPPAPTAPVIPVPPAAPLSSRLYAGVNASFGSSSAYGIVLGSTQVFGVFGAQVGVDYNSGLGALSIDALLTYRPKLSGKFQPYVGVGVGLTSSAAAVPTTTQTTATDYATQVALGSDYLLTSDIAAYAEGSYRAALSSKGRANGAGARAHLGLKFLF